MASKETKKAISSKPDKKRRLMFMVSTEGNSPEEITDEIITAHDKFMVTVQEVKEELDRKERKTLRSKNEEAFNRFVERISKQQEIELGLNDKG